MTAGIFIFDLILWFSSNFIATFVELCSCNIRIKVGRNNKYFTISGFLEIVEIYFTSYAKYFYFDCWLAGLFRLTSHIFFSIKLQTTKNKSIKTTIDPTTVKSSFRLNCKEHPFAIFSNYCFCCRLTFYRINNLRLLVIYHLNFSIYL